jgi:mono/diheme cytochrome c family protein
MKRVLAAIVVVLAGATFAGCAKASRSDVAISSPSSSVPAPVDDAGDTHRGRTIFGNNCSMCHGSTGEEGGVGPSLRGESSRKSPGATVAWIENPDPPMPKLYPAPLSRQDVSDVAAYVQTL